MASPLGRSDSNACKFLIANHERQQEASGCLSDFLKVHLDFYSKKTKYRKFSFRKIQQWRNQDISDEGNLNEFVSSWPAKNS